MVPGHPSDGHSVILEQYNLTVVLQLLRPRAGGRRRVMLIERLYLAGIVLCFLVIAILAMSPALR